MSHLHGVASEVGRLRAVLLHRPGAELARRGSRRPGVGAAAHDRAACAERVSEDHDALAQMLREHGVDVLYLTRLLRDAMAHRPARRQAVAAALDAAMLGDELAGQLHRHLEDLDLDALSQALVAGLTAAEFRTGRGLVYRLLDEHDFLIDPLPDLLFTRDSSVWLRGGVAVASSAARTRRREARLHRVVYEHHPMFAGTVPLYRPGLEPLAGGDVLPLTSGVIAIGIGQHTVPAAVERLARRVFDTGSARTALAVRMDPRWPGTLDTACALVDVDTIVMPPTLAYTLTAQVIRPGADRLEMSGPEPFLEAAAREMGVDHVRVIDADVDPGAAGPGRCGPAGDPLVIAPRLVVCYQASADAAALEAAGIEVIRVPGGEPHRFGGGPRRLSCPIAREPS